MNLLNNNIPEYGVTEFNKIFSETISTAFNLIKIRGEISNLKKHQSGHFYFSLKDEDSVISAVCFRPIAAKLSFKPEEGAEVVVTGKVSTYARSISVYQINVENIKISGEGALLKLIQERKKKLQKNGFFDEDKKKPIPYIPNIIGIITSPTGSVIKDIINRIKERFPRTIQLWPVSVQGNNSSNEIIKAIEGFNNLEHYDKPDVIIIARGGGSIEDLMPFNNENLAKSVFNSKIPIISAIGHETDTTIIDFVSDLRASTPTAAAEKCVPVRKDLKKSLSNLSNTMNHANQKIIVSNKERFNKLERLLQDPSKIIIYFRSNLNNLVSLTNYNIQNKITSTINELLKLSSHLINPNEKLNNQKIIMNNLWGKTSRTIIQKFNNNKERIKNLSRLLHSSSIDNTLKRGYVIIKKNKKIISRSKFLNNNELVNIQFYDNKVSAKIKKN